MQISIRILEVLLLSTSHVAFGRAIQSYGATSAVEKYATDQTSTAAGLTVDDIRPNIHGKRSLEKTLKFAENNQPESTPRASDASVPREKSVVSISRQEMPRGILKNTGHTSKAMSVPAPASGVTEKQPTALAAAGGPSNGPPTSDISMAQVDEALTRLVSLHKTNPQYQNHYERLRQDIMAISAATIVAASKLKGYPKGLIPGVVLRDAYQTEQLLISRVRQVPDAPSGPPEELDDTGLQRWKDNFVARTAHLVGILVAEDEKIVVAKGAATKSKLATPRSLFGAAGPPSDTLFRSEYVNNWLWNTEDQTSS